MMIDVGGGKLVPEELVHTHYAYVCRTCKAELLEKITWPHAEGTPIPTCCTGKRRDMAFVGARKVYGQS